MILYDKDGPYVPWSSGAILDISNDWTDWMTGEGVSALDTCTWSSPSGLAKLSETADAGLAAVLLQHDGTTAGPFVVTNTVTAGSKTDSRQIRVRIEPRYAAKPA